MKSHEFITEAGIDDAYAQAGTQPASAPKKPFNQSGLGNWIGGKSTNPIANAISPTNVINKLTGVASGFTKAWGAGANAGLGGVDVAYKGPPGQQTPQQSQPQTQPNQETEIKYVANKPDPRVANYLKQAAGGKPLQQNTGNAQLDQLLKNAGLLK